MRLLLDTHAAAWFYLARGLPPVASTLSVMFIPVLGVLRPADSKRPVYRQMVAPRTVFPQLPPGPQKASS